MYTSNLSKIQELLPLLDNQSDFTIKLDHSLKVGASVDLDTKIINVSKSLTDRINKNNGLTAAEKFEIYQNIVDYHFI